MARPVPVEALLAGCHFDAGIVVLYGRWYLSFKLSDRDLVSMMSESSKHLNNLIEEDHRRVKQRLRPMLGLKSFETAKVVIGGPTATMAEIWQAALAA